MHRSTDAAVERALVGVRSAVCVPRPARAEPDPNPFSRPHPHPITVHPGRSDARAPHCASVQQHPDFRVAQAQVDAAGARLERWKARYNQELALRS